MQKNEGLIFSFSDKFVFDFQKDLEILPQHTPHLICDRHGKILFRQNVDMPKNSFCDISLMLCESERNFYLSNRNEKDSLLLDMSDAEKESFLVLSKTECGLLRGVVCSDSSGGCIRLNEYLEKLCCYKDYLLSFSDIAFSEKAGLPALKRLDARINGSGHLLELCSFDFLEHEERFAFPICAATNKIASFISASENGIDVRVDNGSVAKNLAAVVPLRFFRVLASCISVAARYSMDGRIKIGFFETGRGNVKFSITSSAAGYKNADIFEKAATLALEGMGIPVKVAFSDGVYAIEFILKTEMISETILAEEDEATRRISAILADGAFADMIFTIAG